MSRGESEDDDTDDDDADESVHCWCGRDCDFSKVDIVDVERGGTTWGRGEVGARHTRVSVDTFLFCSFFSFIRLVCAFSPKTSDADERAPRLFRSSHRTYAGEDTSLTGVPFVDYYPITVPDEEKVLMFFRATIARVRGVLRRARLRYQSTPMLRQETHEVRRASRVAIERLD